MGTISLGELDWPIPIQSAEPRQSQPRYAVLHGTYRHRPWPVRFGPDTSTSRYRYLKKEQMAAVVTSPLGDNSEGGCGWPGRRQPGSTVTMVEVGRGEREGGKPRWNRPNGGHWQRQWLWMAQQWMRTATTTADGSNGCTVRTAGRELLNP